MLAGCATSSPGPVGPISTGQPRVDPEPGTDISDIVDPNAPEEEVEIDFDEFDQRGPYTPPHMEGRELVRAGIMLPFSHPNSNLRKQSEGMLGAIEMALFDYAGENFVILPKDTAGNQGIAEEAALDLSEQGVDFVLGPLFGANVTRTKEVLAEEAIPLVAFSNDNSVAGEGAWLASITPEEEARAIVAYTALRGYDTFAFFGPDSTRGRVVAEAMQMEVFDQAGFMLATQFYEASNQNPQAEAESLALTIMAATERGERVAVLVPESGNRLRRIAPLLAYYGVDTRAVKFIGTSGWNDPNVWREPSFLGAWFPATPSDEIEFFEQRYERLYGTEPSSLASIAYDAAALAIALSDDGALSFEDLANPDGFVGVNGLFRFRPDGTAERAFVIMEVDPRTEEGAKQIRRAPSAFEPDIG